MANRQRFGASEQIAVRVPVAVLEPARAAAAAGGQTLAGWVVAAMRLQLAQASKPAPARVPVGRSPVIPAPLVRAR